MNKMNKFKKNNPKINKNIFSTNPPSKIMNKPEIKQEPLIEKSLIEEPLIEEVKTITINQLSKNDLNNKPIPKMKLIVDEVILNMKKKKLNGWKIN